MFCKSLFVRFPLAIVLSVRLRFTDSDYPFGIYTLFFRWRNNLSEKKNGTNQDERDFRETSRIRYNKNHKSKKKM